MIAYVIYILIAGITGYVFYKNRKDFGDSLRANENGFSERRLIAFQLMLAVFAGDTVYVYKFYVGSAWAEKHFMEFVNTHLIYVMFTLGFLSFPEIIKLINTIRGNPVKDEVKKEEGV